MEDNYDSFINFRANIIGEIFKYAKENGLDPNATLKNVGGDYYINHDDRLI